MKIRQNPFFPASVKELSQALGVYWRELAREISKTAWDDLRMPAQGINPAGTPAPPVIDDTTIPGTLLFSAVTENVIAGVAQMPHAWRRGSVIRPHVHWAKTTNATGGVVWELAYAIADNGGTIGAYSAWVPGTNVIDPGATANKLVIDTFGDLAMAGYKESAMLVWKIRRNVAASGDDYGASARLLEFDIHYQRDKSGTDSDIPD